MYQLLLNPGIKELFMSITQSMFLLITFLFSHNKCPLIMSRNHKRKLAESISDVNWFDPILLYWGVEPDHSYHRRITEQILAAVILNGDHMVDSCNGGRHLMNMNNTVRFEVRADYVFLHFTANVNSKRDWRRFITTMSSGERALSQENIICGNLK